VAERLAASQVGLNLKELIKVHLGSVGVLAFKAEALDVHHTIFKS
jgi:hypothetical protein